MGLLRFLRGKRTSLNNAAAQDGSIYVCINDGTVHFDYTDDDGNIQRQQFNAGNAETLSGATVSTTLNQTDSEIPTSLTVFNEVAKMAEKEQTRQHQALACRRPQSF